MQMLLLSRWTEPCNGYDIAVIDVTNDEKERIQSVIDWLEKNAGGDYGHTLCSWELMGTKKVSEKIDLIGFDAVMGWIALNSRYNETGKPGDYYGGNTHPDLDGR